MTTYLRKIEIEGYHCVCLPNPKAEKVIYMIYPFVDGFDEQWLQTQSTTHGVALVVVYVPLSRWNEELTPWPEPPEAKGFEPFGGDAPTFLDLLITKIVPECETGLSFRERDLMGVSLAGLFTLWQWLNNDTFDSIACLSGSFWYNGFLDWVDNHTVPSKKGVAYFLLGTAEPKAKIKAYQSVGINTEAIVKRLESAGITTRFDWVPGNHFANPKPRAEKALQYLSIK